MTPKMQAVVRAWLRRNKLLSEVARLQIAYEAVDERNAKEGVDEVLGAPVISVLDQRDAALRKFMIAEMDYLYTCAALADEIRDA